MKEVIIINETIGEDIFEIPEVDQKIIDEFQKRSNEIDEIITEIFGE